MHKYILNIIHLLDQTNDVFQANNAKLIKQRYTLLSTHGIIFFFSVLVNLNLIQKFYMKFLAHEYPILSNKKTQLIIKTNLIIAIVKRADV